MNNRGDIKVYTWWWKRSVTVHVSLLHLLLLVEIEFSECLVEFFLQLLLLLVKLLSRPSLCLEVGLVDLRLRKRTRV